MSVARGRCHARRRSAWHLTPPSNGRRPASFAGQPPPLISKVRPHCCGTGKLRASEVDMQFQLECEREDDGRWLAEIAAIPGVIAYGASANEAMAKAEVLALRVLAEQLEHGEAKPSNIRISLPAAA